MPGPLDGLRKQVLDIDRGLVRLLAERMAVVLEIGRVKADLGVPVEDPEREQEVLAHVLGLPHRPMEDTSLEELYRHIVRIFREAQTRTLPPEPKEQP
jgi:chorismate mutase